MQKIIFTSEESAELKRLYGLYADATPLALYILQSRAMVDKVVIELWRKLNALAFA